MEHFYVSHFSYYRSSSNRILYEWPRFLAHFPETVKSVTKGIMYAVFRGCIDSIKGTVGIFILDKQIKEKASQSTPKKDATPRRRDSSRKDETSKVSSKEPETVSVLSRALQCCALNGVVFLFSIFLFECGVLPFLRFFLSILFGHSPDTENTVWSWIHPILTWTFSTMWVLPLFLLSKIVNSLWFQDIADSAYRHTRGRPQMLSSVSKLIADLLFSILVQALFLVQSMLVSLLPIMFLNELLSLIHMCMLYSLYSFEYKWLNMGWELHQRLNFMENNWPYFVGFGLPLAVLTALPSSFIVSGCIFSMVFPMFIISGNEAVPVTGVCDYPLQLFSPVIAISNALFNRTIGTKHTPSQAQR
ncbi:etoposide-induced protein 2.4 homolog isoform X1 [Schistocerca serialis cubense]|uniref:etoposide-induced protein 2.4 homolog isoform X1 n=1 Tax=Schistocerca serialis cubense TaxID=2023355 RepID=UPI00214ECCB5|nr:etoposide-induced protein 2.4 homolog isoform X1 [Schistocerca serialis cubense]